MVIGRVIMVDYVVIGGGFLGGVVVVWLFEDLNIIVMFFEVGGLGNLKFVLIFGMFVGLI